MARSKLFFTLLMLTPCLAQAAGALTHKDFLCLDGVDASPPVFTPASLLGCPGGKTEDDQGVCMVYTGCTVVSPELQAMAPALFDGKKFDELETDQLQALAAPRAGEESNIPSIEPRSPLVPLIQKFTKTYQGLPDAQKEALSNGRNHLDWQKTLLTCMGRVRNGVTTCPRPSNCKGAVLNPGKQRAVAFSDADVDLMREHMRTGENLMYVPRPANREVTGEGVGK